MNKDWPRAVIFDLDGTLVDSAPDLAGALNDLLAEEGLGSLPLEQVRLMIGGGVPKLVERGMRACDRQADDARIEELAARFLELYTPRATKLSKLFPGACELLEHFKAEGRDMAVCTNKPEAVSVRMLDDLGVLPMLGAVVGGDTLPVKKPNPAPLYSALRTLGYRETDAVLVGDSPVDAQAARNGRIPVLLVTFGYTRVPVTEIDCDGIVENFADVPAALARIAP